MDPGLILRVAFGGLFSVVALVVPLLLGYILFSRAGRESLSMGVQNLGRSPLRTTLTMFGIVIGVGAVVAVISMGDGAAMMVTNEVAETGGTSLIEVYRDEWDKQGGSTLTSRINSGRGWGRGRRNRAKPLDYTDYQNLREMLPSDVVVSAEDDRGRGVDFRYGDKEIDGGMVGVTTNFQVVYNWNVERGRFFDEAELTEADKVIVLGSDIASFLFEGKDPLGKEVRAQSGWGENQEALRFQVIGVMASKGATSATEGWDEKTLIPLTAFHSRVSGSTEVERMRVKAPNVAEVPMTIARIKRIISRRHDDADAFQYWTATEEIATAEKLGMILKLLMGVVAGIALVVAGIGIMNIMLVSVTERTREIGLRKALGARRSDIMFQFLIETSVMSLLGGAIGTGLGVLLGRLSAAGLQKYVLAGAVWPSVVSTNAIAAAVGVAFVIGIISGVYPASRAAKLTPVEALRTD
ncbi:MAG: ABC transporter permease [Candidatus Poribacteria bacterium]|nr:ABC transporter permease [Candidatus Poribacteria bacterium]